MFKLDAGLGKGPGWRATGNIREPEPRPDRGGKEGQAQGQTAATEGQEKEAEAQAAEGYPEEGQEKAAKAEGQDQEAGHEKEEAQHRDRQEAIAFNFSTSETSPCKSI